MTLFGILGVKLAQPRSSTLERILIIFVVILVGFVFLLLAAGFMDL